MASTSRKLLHLRLAALGALLVALALAARAPVKTLRVKLLKPKRDR